MGFSEFKTWRDMSKVVIMSLRWNSIGTDDDDDDGQQTTMRNINLLPRWSLFLIYFGVSGTNCTDEKA